MTAKEKSSKTLYQGRWPMNAYGPGAVIGESLVLTVLPPVIHNEIAKTLSFLNFPKPASAYSTPQVGQAAIRELSRHSNALTTEDQLEAYSKLMTEMMLRTFIGDPHLFKISNPKDYLPHLKATWEAMQQVIADRVDDIDKLGDLLNVFVNSTLHYITPESPVQNENKQLDFTLNEEQAEFLFDQTADLLTSGPLVKKIVRKIDQGGMKYSAIMQPMWDNLVEKIGYVDKKALGNWFASEGHDRTRVGTMILQIASDLNIASDIAKAVPGGDLDQIEQQSIMSFIAETEPFTSALLRSNKSDVALTYELRRLVEAVGFVLSPDTPLEQVLAVKGDPRISANSYFKEALKIVRDKDIKRLRQNNKVETKANEKTVKIKLGEVQEVQAASTDVTAKTQASESLDQLGTMQVEFTKVTGLLEGITDPDLANAIVKVFCGPVADASDVNKQVITDGFQDLSIAYLLLHYGRKTLPGRAIFKIPKNETAQKELTENEAMLSDALVDLIQMVGPMINMAVDNPAGINRDGRMVLNSAERAAFIIDFWSRVLAERKESNNGDDLSRAKDKARTQFAYTMLGNFLNPGEGQPEVVKAAVKQALKNIGLTWPPKQINNLVVEYFRHLVNDGKVTRDKLLELGDLIGIIRWDSVVNMEADVNPFIDNPTIDGLEKEMTSGAILTTAARGEFVKAMTFIIKYPNVITGHPLIERGVNETNIKQLSEIYSVYKIHKLQEALNGQTNINNFFNLLLGMRFFLHQVKENTLVLALRNQVDQMINIYFDQDALSGIEFRRLGYNKFFNFDQRIENLRVMNEDSLMQDIKIASDIAETIWGDASVIIDQASRVIQRFATDKEKKLFTDELVDKIEGELSYPLTHDQDTPSNFRDFILKTQGRVHGIREHVVDSFKLMMKDTQLFVGSTELEALLLDRVNDAELFKKIWDKVSTERKKIDTEIAKAQDKLIFPIDGTARGNVQFAAKTLTKLFQTLMEDAKIDGVLSVGDAEKLVAALSSTGEKGGVNMSSLGNAISQILSFLGAAGFGYAMGQGYQAQAATVQSSLNAGQSASEVLLGLGTADVDAYRKARQGLITLQIDNIEGVYKSKIELLKAIEDNVDSAEREKIADAINATRTLATRQYNQLKTTIQRTFDTLDEITRIQLDIQAMDIKEAQQSYKWLQTFLSQSFPVIKELQRMFSDLYGFDIDLSKWADPNKLFPTGLPEKPAQESVPPVAVDKVKN